MDRNWINKQINEMVMRKYTNPMTPQEQVNGGLSALPVIGDAISGYDAYNSAKNGNYGEAALNAIGLLPFIPGIAGITKKVDTSALKKLDDSYRMEHSSPGRNDNAPLHDLTGNGNIYPDDVYSKKAVEYYGTGDSALDSLSFGRAQSFRGKPDAEVEIYRAVPKGLRVDINAGDWVSINPNYAKQHGKSFFKDGYTVIKKKVKANELFTNGDSIHEWGYHPGSAE